MGFGTPTVELEGNYSTWNLQWLKPIDLYDYDLYGVDEANDTLILVNVDNSKVGMVKISDGSVITEFTALTYISGYFAAPHSISRYFAFVKDVAGVKTLQIYKDSVLKQSIDCDALGIIFTSTTNPITISRNGKYIVVQYAKPGTALFKGS